MQNKMTTAETIRTMRAKAGLTQQQLADLMQVKQPKVSQWESGKVEPLYKTMLKIIKICSVT